MVAGGVAGWRRTVHTEERRRSGGEQYRGTVVEDREIQDGGRKRRVCALFAGRTHRVFAKRGAPGGACRGKKNGGDRPGRTCSGRSAVHALVVCAVCDRRKW